MFVYGNEDQKVDMNYIARIVRQGIYRFEAGCIIIYAR